MALRGTGFAKGFRTVGGRAYDGDPLDEKFREQRGIGLMAPHRKNHHRKTNPTQDGRPLRRTQRRWKIERQFAWLHNFRRVVVRRDYYPEHYQGFLQLGCIPILLRQF
ncbi:MAG: transposase [SAR324 cluster bacterium]|nr:transposase [SAR324 cluster bacterium]